MSIDLFAWLRAPGWAALASAAALLTVNAASAQDCTKDSDCGAGYMCKSYPAPPCATPAIACAKGEKCPPPVPADCDQTDYKSCAPAQCAKDSDCPDDMLCVGHSSGGCTSAGSAPPMATCKPDEHCAQPEPTPTPTPEPECTTDVVTECTPRYLVPCKHDADCGDGFKCKELIAMSCSGSAGVGTSGGGSAPSAGGMGGAPAQDAGMAEPPPPPAPPTCTSEPTGEFMCELQVLPCDTADDCPATFECQSNPNRAVCSSAATPPTPNDGTGGHATPSADAGVDNGDSAGSAGAGSAGAGSAPDDSCGGANDGLPASVCIPHNYYYGSASDSRGALGEGTATGTSGNAKGGDGAPVPATAPVDGNGGKGGAGGEGGETSSTHSASSSSNKDMDAKASGGGCAVAAPGSETGQGLGLLSMLGMTALLLRRRARKAA